jgi:hypothetical protein
MASLSQPTTKEHSSPLESTVNRAIKTTVQKAADAGQVPIGRRRAAVRHSDSKRHVTALAAEITKLTRVPHHLPPPSEPQPWPLPLSPSPFRSPPPR